MKTQEIVENLKKDLEENLLCIAEYGLTEKQYVVVVDELGFKVLASIQETTKKLAKKGVHPLFIMIEELSDGRDIFPLEFLNMKVTRRLLHGKDVFEKMVFNKEHVRRELEFEFRSKLITLRQGYIETVDSRKNLAALVSKAVPTLAPVCYGMLYLKDIEPPKDVDGLLSSISRAYEVNVDVLSALSKTDAKKLSVDELKMHVKKLMRFLADFGEVLDELKV